MTFWIASDAARSCLNSNAETVHPSDRELLPECLLQLVERRYIRSVPIDPITDSATDWVLLPHPDGQTVGVYDVKSNAPGEARDGSSFASW